MKVAIYAYEEFYGGMHGINAFDIIEVDDINEAKEIAMNMSYNVYEDYCYNDEYDSPDDYDYAYDIYKIRDEFQNKSVEELSQKYDGDLESFIEKYCEEEIF